MAAATGLPAVSRTTPTMEPPQMWAFAMARGVDTATAATSISTVAWAPSGQRETPCYDSPRTFASIAVPRPSSYLARLLSAPGELVTLD